MNWYFHYPSSKPRKVKGGGIKARNLHGKIGNTWWSERWIQTLDSFGWTNRLERGRRYARMGQVVEFNLSKGSVEAKVQGSRPKPYIVKINIGQIPDNKWAKILEALGSKAAFAAKLLSGEMPQNMEGVFQSRKAALFPSKSELKTDCSCPDDANPCKHIAAVYYILAEEFDRDPFMIFKLRGRTKEETLDALRKGRPATGRAESVVTRQRKEEKTKAVKPLSEFMHSYWNSPASKDIRISIGAPRVNAAIVKRLGEPPFWREPKDFTKLMEGIYERVTKEALKLAFE